jgi:aldehyde dehydrogenase (NAD+)
MPVEKALSRYGVYIDGTWEEPEADRWIQSYNPAKGEPWALFPDASEAQVDRAVKAAHRAFTSGEWPKMVAADRARLLRKMAEVLPGAVETLAQTETVDCGKIITETRAFGAICGAYYSFFADLADKLHGETYTPPQPGMHAHTLREPLGVVAAIVPWNNQLWLLSLKLGPALAAGNTVVIKPSEVSAAPTLEFVKLLEGIGLPKGVVNVVTGGGEPCGRALTSHPLVDRIAFTGGPETARHILRNSANNLAPVSLELGGKSPVIVFPDADLANAVNSICAGVFIGSSGQSCVAGSRVYVHESIYDRFVADLLAKVKTLKVGDPFDEKTQMGPLATQGQLTRIEAEIAKAVDGGAVLLHGGRRPAGPGWFIEPTVLACPDQQQPIVDTELFGPVLCVLPFKDEEEVVRLANDTKYGLAAGLFTRDLGRTLRMTRAIRAGIQYVNCYRVSAPVTEIGGFKNSGSSREGGLQALQDYSRPKTIWINTLV